MNNFIAFAKLLMIIIWGGLLSNLFFPFAGQTTEILYLLLGFTGFMHLLQLWIIHRFFAKKIKLTKFEALQICIFGIFKLWEIRKRLA